jgi:hypothetical protein
MGKKNGIAVSRVTQTNEHYNNIPHFSRNRVGYILYPMPYNTHCIRCRWPRRTQHPLQRISLLGAILRTSTKCVNIN